MTGRALVVVGDALLDRDVSGSVDRLCPEAPVPVVDVEADGERSRPGGAGLAALLAARDGRPVVLVTALGDDAAGREVARMLEAAGVEVVDLRLHGRTPEKTRIIAEGQLALRVDRGGGAATSGGWTTAAGRAVASAAAVLVADYGRGLAADPDARGAIAALSQRVPVVWDPHPRGPAPVPGARLATPNRREASALVPDVAGEGLAGDATRARALARRWGAAAVAVTRGAAGAVLCGGDSPPLAVPAPRSTTPVPEAGSASPAPDPCGAGDRFAATAAALLGDGALPSEAVTSAVAAASRYVAEGGAGGVGRAIRVEKRVPPPDGPLALACRAREEGATLVAAGGCFDLLHAGHVRMLEAARALGDCLVVCLNSDASVRRLKGEGRPVVPEADRVAVLMGLACVDGVAVFDEDTPEALLGKLRPHLFVKGADYAVGELPEARIVARWGGQAVVVPFLEGRSTSTLVDALARRA